MTDTQSTGPRPAPSLPSGLSQAQYCLLLSPTASSKSERITLSTWRTSRIGRVRRKRKKQKITPMARRMKSRESKASVFRTTARVASRPTARFVSQTSPVSLHTTGAQPRTSLFLKSYVRFVSLMKRELQVPTTKPTLLPTSATGKINAVKLLNSYSSWDPFLLFLRF